MDLTLDFNDTALSTWLREGDFLPGLSAYYALLAFHAAGMAVVVGTWWILSLRLLGYFNEVPLSIADYGIALCWWGFFVNLASGIGLFLAQPVRDLMTPVFDVKMVLIAGALLGMATVRQWLEHVRIALPVPTTADAAALPARARIAVLLTDCCWLGAIIGGRLIGYLQPPPI